MLYGRENGPPPDENENPFAPVEEPGFSFAPETAPPDEGINPILVRAAMADPAIREKNRKPPPRPKAEDLLKEYDRLSPLFQPRNQVVGKWRDFARLADEYKFLLDRALATAKDDDNVPFMVTQAATIVKRTVQNLGSHDVRITIIPETASDEDGQKAERAETFARKMRACWNDDFRASGMGMSRQEGIFRHLTEDGQVYEVRSAVLKRIQMPTSTRLLDPTDCIPVWGNTDGVDGMIRLYHSVIMDGQNARDRFKIDIGEKGEDEPFKLINFYDDWYVGVLNRDTRSWAQKPTLHKFGRIPVDATFVNGFPSVSGGEDEMSREKREATRGRALIADHMGTLQRMSQHLQLMTIALKKAVNRPYVATNGPSDSGIDYDDKPHGVTNINAGSKVEFPQSDMLIVPLAQALITHDTNSLQADALLYDPNLERQSGFDRMIASLEAQETKAALVSAFEDHERRVLTHSLSMVRSLALAALIDPIPMVEEKAGLRSMSEFVPLDVPEYPEVEVKQETMSLHNRVQLTQQLVGPVGARLLSQYTAIDTAGFADPAREVQRIQQEQALQNPEALKAQTPFHVIRSLMDLKAQEELRGGEQAQAMTSAIDLLLMQQIKALVEAGKKPPQPPGQPPQGPQGPEGGPMDPMGGMPMGGPEGPPPMDPAMMAAMSGGMTDAGVAIPPGVGGPGTSVAAATGGMSELGDALSRMNMGG